MQFLDNPWQWIQYRAAADMTELSLRLAITLWAALMIYLAWSLHLDSARKTKLALGLMLAYEVLP
jgi:hypothetical protein